MVQNLTRAPFHSGSGLPREPVGEGLLLAGPLQFRSTMAEAMAAAPLPNGPKTVRHLTTLVFMKARGGISFGAIPDLGWTAMHPKLPLDCRFGESCGFEFTIVVGMDYIPQRSYQSLSL